MNEKSRMHAIGKLVRKCGPPLCALAMMASVMPAHAAEEGAALAKFKAMASYLTSQPTFSVAYDSDIEVVTPALQKLQFSASGTVLMKRPGEFRISRTGGYADVMLISDGKTLTVSNSDGQLYAQMPAPGSFDQTVDKLRAEMATDIPGADLLLTKLYDELTDGVIEAKYIGPSVVQGIPCDHLAFRNAETDWQIWISSGDHPLPMKYVITSKTVVAAPEYTLRLHDWKMDVKPAPDAFVFKPAPGAKGVALSAIGHVDEIPTGSIEGMKK